MEDKELREREQFKAIIKEYLGGPFDESYTISEDAILDLMQKAHDMDKWVPEKPIKIFDLYSMYYGDGGHSYEFYHDSKTDDEFKADVELLLDKYKDEVFIFEEDCETWIGVSSFVDVIANHMPEFGYKHFEYYRNGYFGSDILRERDNEDEAPFLKLLGADTAQKVFDHNKRIEDNL